MKENRGEGTKRLKHFSAIAFINGSTLEPSDCSF